MSSPALGPCICNHLLSIKTLHPKKAHAARSLSDAISILFFFLFSDLLDLGETALARTNTLLSPAELKEQVPAYLLDPAQSRRYQAANIKYNRILTDQKLHESRVHRFIENSLPPVQTGEIQFTEKAVSFICSMTLSTHGIHKNLRIFIGVFVFY